MRLFLLDGPVFRFLSFVYDLLILNITYVITCLPVVTAGAATSALYRTMLDRRYGRDAGVRVYFRFFRDNLRQSTPRYLLFLLIGALLIFDIRYTRSGDIPMRRVLVPVLLLLLIALLILSSWVLALTGQFNNSFRGTLKNAALLAPGHPLITLLLLLRFLPVLLAFGSAELFLAASFLFFFFYFSLAAWLAAIPMSKLFLTLMSPEEAAERTDKKLPR